MSVLEWLLILEVALLALAGVLWLTAYMTAREDPHDPMWAFARTFWRIVLTPPPREPDVASAGAGSSGDGDVAVIPEEEMVEVDNPGSPPAAAGSAPRSAVPAVTPPAPSPPAPPASQPDRGGNRIQNAQLALSVSFNCELDRVLGRDANGLLLEVSAAAEDTAANRTVIQLVSAALGVKAYQVTLTRGHFLAKKGIAITGMSQDELNDRLDELFG